MLLYIVKVLSETAALCKTSTNPRVMLEASAVKICDPASDGSTEAFAARLGKIEAMIATGRISTANVSVAAPVAVESVVPTVTEQPTVDEPMSSTEEDDEEYVSDAEEYVEEDFPPFDIPSLPPVPEDIPPFETVPAEESLPFDAPIKESSSIEQPPTAESQTFNVKAVDEASEEPETSAEININVNQLADTLANLHAAIAPMLRMSKIQVRDDIYYVIAQDIFKNAMLNDKTFTENLKGLLKCEHLKYVTDAEFNGTNNKDPLDDIIAMADDIDQISIF